MENIEFTSGVKYEIYIGIKDKDSYEEILSIEDFKSVLCEICYAKEINFSLLTQTGGYKHGRGYTTETSLRIIIIGIDENEVKLLSERLKKKINTDTVLIAKTEIDYCFA